MSASTHELLVREMKKGQNCAGAIEKPKFSGISDQYIILDSFIKAEIESKPERGFFRWNLTDTGLTSSEAINISEPLANIIEIQIYPFYVPDLPTTVAPTVVDEPTSPTDDKFYLVKNGEDADLLMDQLPQGSRFTIHLERAGKIAFNGMNNKSHNFEFKVATNEATPINENFIFTEPVRHIDNLTLQFNTPDNSLVFDSDVFAHAPVTLESNYMRIYCPNHGLTQLDRIYLANCTCADQELKSYLTNTVGFPAHVYDANYISIDPNIYAGTHSAFPFNVDVRIAKKRLRIPIRVRRLVNRITNQKIP